MGRVSPVVKGSTPMKTANTISDVIRASKAQNAKRELSAEELDAVRGGDGYTVPYGSPQYGEWKEGYDMANTGSNNFWTAAGAMGAAATLAPPPADLVGVVMAGGAMATAGEQMDRGEAMMDHAQAQYDANQYPQPDYDGAGGAGNGGGDGGYHGAGGYGNDGSGGAGGGYDNDANNY